MAFENKTLGELLDDPRIRPIAPDAIRRRDLRNEDAWNMTLGEIHSQQFFTSDIGRGMERLYAAADSGSWYFPLYSEEECAEDSARRGVNVVWLPSADPEAAKKPFVLLVPGGGFVNVWNLTEGWPIAAQFNELGYHVAVLTYQVEGTESLLEKDMEDFARALRLIRDKRDIFHADADRYITCGFSAGGYLVCLWNTGMGYPAHGLPKPQAVIPVYPFVSPRFAAAGEEPGTDTEEDMKDDLRLYGSSLWDALEKDYEIPEHAEGFPPCAIFLAAGDELVDPEHSKILARALEKAGIPCRLEIGPTGGHGFADGTGMCMAGWPERAIRWIEGQADLTC